MKHIKITLLLAIAASNTLYGFNPGDAASAGTSGNQKQGKYICCHCGKPWNNSSNRIAHERTHTDERPYKCPYCDDTFRRSTHAQIHVRYLHPGEIICYMKTEPNSAPSNKTDAEDTCTATPSQMPAQRDYRERSQSSDPVSRRERSPEPRAEQDDSSSSPVMSPGESDQTLSYTNPTAPTNQEPAQHSQIALLPVEMSERNRELAGAYTKDDGTEVDLFETARELQREYEEFAGPLRPLHTEEEIWGLWRNYLLEQPQTQL